MKQLVVLSGKGGTGKTSFLAAFAHSALSSERHKATLVDADVDASNLELLLHPKKEEVHPFLGGKKAKIDPGLCQGCGCCEQVCRFQAIVTSETSFIRRVDPIACEGCAACAYQCPESAIRMEEHLAGHWYRSESHLGSLFHANLLPAQENSGKLVSIIKQHAREKAQKEEDSLLLIDGPPGTGCPVISAMSGTDLVVLIAEPSVSGLHDMNRIVEITKHFHIPSLVCINKADLSWELTQQIEDYCQQRSLEILGKVLFDEAITAAMMDGSTIHEYCPQCQSSQSLQAIWERLEEKINSSE